MAKSKKAKEKTEREREKAFMFNNKSLFKTPYEIRKRNKKPSKESIGGKENV